MRPSVHRHCERFEESLKAAKRFYRACTFTAIAVGTIIALNYDSIPGWATLVIGTVLALCVLVTGQTVENRAYVLAHERLVQEEKALETVS